MPDENNAEQTPHSGQQPATDTPPANGGERTFTQSEIDQIVQARLNRERQKWQEQSTPAKTQPSQKTAPAREAKDQLSERLDALEAQNAVLRAFQGKTLTPSQQRMAEREFLSERPDDVSSWAERLTSDFGLGAKASEQSTPAPEINNKPQGPPVTSTGTAAPPSSANENTPLIDLSEADRAALIKQKGVHWYRKTLREQMRSVKVKVRNF